MSAGTASGFRPGEDLTPEDLAAASRGLLRAEYEPAELGFTSLADAGGTDLDVLMGYQLLLGRDPENSFVIADAKSSPVGALLRALMSSGEFQSAVLDRLVSGRKLPHEDSSLGPAPEQLDWLFRLVSLPAAAQLALRTAPDWRSWLGALVDTPGFPRAPSRTAADPDLDAHAAADGFVLVHLEQPKPGERLSPGDVVQGTGWAIAPADVAEVAVHLDDTLLTHARYGLPRPDVARSFPHFRHVDHCGFAFTAAIPRQARLSATSQLVVSVRTVRGEVGRKAVRAQPPPDAPEPALEAGAPDTWPIRLAVDEALVDDGGTLRLRGWAASHAALRHLVVSLGDTVLGEAQHGLPRPDIAQAHPRYANAAQSGFSLVRALGQKMQDAGFVRVQVEDERGRSRQVIVPLQMAGGTDADPDPQTQADGMSCACDSASLSEAGLLSVSGWAVDPGGAVPVEIEFDGVLLGTALTGRPRHDIGRRFPDNPGAGHSGFGFAYTLREPPGTGPHRLGLRVLGLRGERLIEHVLAVGQDVAAADPAAARPRSEVRVEIDHPKLAGDQAIDAVRGAFTVSGWAIARQGVAGVSVHCDETLLGQAHLGMRREDIGATFADYEGSLLSGYALVLPPGTLAPGRHRIRVAATALQPAGDGAPERAERVFWLQVEPYDALPPGCDVRDHVPPAERAYAMRLLERHGCRPQIEVVVTRAGASDEAVQATLSSLRTQAYPHWTAKAGQTSVSGGPQLDAAASGPRYLMSLRAGDVLGADALLALAVEAAVQPEAGLIYADEVRHDPSQGRMQPALKPGWSPDLLLATNYVGRPWIARLDVAEGAGLSDADELACGYDAVLRVVEHASSIRHLARVLCRAAGGDTPEAERVALETCLERRGIAASVEPSTTPGTWRVRREMMPGEARRAEARRAEAKRGEARRGEASRADAKRAGGRAASPAPLVSVIMPTCAARGLLRAAIETLRATTAPACPGGVAIEIVAISNIPEHDAPARAWLAGHADRVIDAPGAFNWSRANNLGAAAARGTYLLFLNDDIEAREPGWLEAMLEHAQRPEVGVVGARLLYPDGKVQHGGQYLARTHARHAFRFADAAAPGPFGLAAVAREMMAVTGACQLVRAATFRELGGFEEAHSVVNNDLDFCLRAWAAGLAVIYTPHATLVHHELASRAALEDSYDQLRFGAAWRETFERGDPFRNPRLAADSDHYAPDPEPVEALHVGKRGPAIADVRRILAVKLDHIGDFLTALPALHRLAERFPQARIDLLAPSATVELARLEPVVADVAAFDFFHARSGEGQKGVGEAEFRALHARLAPAGYDMAIDLRMQPETRAVLPHTGAKFLVGYDHEDRFAFLDVALVWEGDRKLTPKRAHISQRLVDLVEAACAACAGYPAPDPAAAADRVTWGEREVPALDALPADFRAHRLVCVHPGVGNPVRQWPPGHYASLIDLFVAEGFRALLIGGPGEASIADDVLRRVAEPGSAESLAGRVELAQLPAVMRACELFVGNNSGPQHLAASLGLPTIGIHSGVVDAAEWAPLGPLAQALRRRMICGPCYLEFAADCPRDLACLTGLLPGQVFEACRPFLRPAAEPRPDPPARARPARRRGS